MRERLPDRRKGFTQRVKIGSQTFYLRTGEYPDGRLGEVFLDAHKEGTFARGVMQSLAMMTSVALQHGVPVQAVVSILRGISYPPNGFVISDAGTSAVKKCASVSDWIAQELAAAYLPAEAAAPAGPTPNGVHTPPGAGSPLPWRPGTVRESVDDQPTVSAVAPGANVTLTPAGD